MWTEITSGGSTVATGFTPLIFNGSVGTQYTVSVANYGPYIFDHWADGSTNSSASLTLAGNTTLTAYYQILTTPPCRIALTVKSADMSGHLFIGMWTVIWSGQSVAATGYTTFVYAAQSGSTYIVWVADYGPYTFNHWSTGSTDPTIEVTPTQATTLVAYYNTPGCAQG